MFNINIQPKCQTNSKNMISSNKKQNPSPVSTRQRPMFSPKEERDLKESIEKKKIPINSSVLSSFAAEKVSKSKNNPSVSPSKKFNLNHTNRSISKESKTPIKKVNLLQSYYSIKNSNNMNNPVVEKKTTSTSRDKNKINNLNQSGSSRINNNYTSNNTNLIKAKGDLSLNNTREKYNSSNSFKEEKKTSTSPVSRKLNSSTTTTTAAKSKSKHPSINLCSISPTRIPSKSHKKEIKGSVKDARVEEKNKTKPRSSPSPNRIVYSEKKVSLLEKYQQMKGITNDKISVNIMAISSTSSNDIIKSTTNSNNSSLLESGRANNKIKNISYEDYKKQFEENLNLKKKLLERPATTKEYNSNLIYTKTNICNISNCNGNNLFLKNQTKKSDVLSSEGSREKSQKRQPTFKDMNTSPLISKKTFKPQTIRKTNNIENISSKLMSSHKKQENGNITSSNSSLLKALIEGRKSSGNDINQDSNSVDSSNSSAATNLISNSNSSNTISVNRPIKNIHHKSKIGYATDSKKKNNQDTYSITQNFTNDLDSIFLSVCDGHGIFGHEVSGFLKKTLPFILGNELKHRIKTGNKDSSMVKNIIEKVFLSVNFILFNDKSIDSNFSGSTSVNVLYTPERLICANVGDSRAVLGRCVNSNWVNLDLSRDHKPSEKDESERIFKSGGRIEPYKDDEGEFYGPERIWLKDYEIPGLAMSRSFGDKVAATVGVICEPEIIEWKLTLEDKFLIVASDGLWEFMDSDECVNIVKDYYINDDIQGALEKLFKESSERWMEHEDCVDDTTIILVFFD